MKSTVARYQPVLSGPSGATEWTVPRGSNGWTLLRVETSSNPAARESLLIFGQRVTEFPFVIDTHGNPCYQDITLTVSTTNPEASAFTAFVTVVEVTPQ